MDAETHILTTVTNGIATDTLRALARTGPEMALQQLRAEIIAIERTLPELCTRKAAAGSAPIDDGFNWRDELATSCLCAARSHAQAASARRS